MNKAEVVWDIAMLVKTEVITLKQLDGFRQELIESVGELLEHRSMDDFQITWKDAGLDKPIIEEKFGGGEPDRTILTLPLSVNSVTNLVTGDEASDEDKKELILSFCQKPRSKSEIQKHLGINSERYVRQKLLMPLLEEGRLERTIPDKPSSPNQKYVKA